MIEMTKSQMQQMNSGTENNHINEITSKKKMKSGASGKSQPRSAQKQEKSTTVPVVEEITKSTNVRILKKNVASVEN
jgi:hypothetical protein